MSDAKHTPGPWVPVLDETYHVTAPDKGRVAISTNLKGAHGMGGRRAGDEVAANTRLIAAAPELLEALQSLEREGWFKDIVTRCQAARGGASLYASVTQARAAIAKATGGASHG